MHLYILPRGIKKETDQLITFLQAQMFPYEYEGRKIHVQLAVRPLIPYELVFPKECLQEVMNSLWDNDPSPDNKKLAMACAGFRKILGAKPIPKLDKTGMKRIIPHENVGILPIGIKDDHLRPDGKTEML